MLKRISFVTKLCCVAKQFADEFVLQRISSLTRVRGARNPFADESVLHRISSMMSLCLRESVP